MLFLDVCNDLLNESLINLKESKLTESETELNHDKFRTAWEKAKAVLQEWNELSDKDKEKEEIMPAERNLDEIADCMSDSLISFFEMGMKYETNFIRKTLLKDLKIKYY